MPIFYVICECCACPVSPFHKPPLILLVPPHHTVSSAMTDGYKMCEVVWSTLARVFDDTFRNNASGDTVTRAANYALTRLHFQWTYDNLPIPGILRKTIGIPTKENHMHWIHWDPVTNENNVHLDGLIGFARIVPECVLEPLCLIGYHRVITKPVVIFKHEYRIIRQAVVARLQHLLDSIRSSIPLELIVDYMCYIDDSDSESESGSESGSESDSDSVSEVD